MEIYERELIQVGEKIEAAGKAVTDFRFDRTFQEPDPDGGGMFTVYYDIVATYLPTGKSVCATGGIGLRWVEEFAEALDSGYFEA